MVGGRAEIDIEDCMEGRRVMGGACCTYCARGEVEVAWGCSVPLPLSRLSVSKSEWELALRVLASELPGREVRVWSDRERKLPTSRVLARLSESSFTTERVGLTR